jgi:pimeloyl-ACP methyl ester carboxylesterase
MTDAAIPVIFIHGLWLHPLSWARWAQVFEAAGYRAMAPGWPGVPDTVEAARANPGSIAGHGIADVTSHYAKIIEGLPAKPILIGHSLGGMIAEKLLGQDLAAAAVTIDAARITGALPLPLPSLWSALPAFRSPAGRHRAVSLTAGQFRDSFGSAVDADESDVLHRRWSIPAPGRPLFEAADPGFALHSPARAAAPGAPHPPARAAATIGNGGPLLLIMGGQDRSVPETVTRSALTQYRRSHPGDDLMEFPDRGHSLTIDHGWRAVAGACLDWLRTCGLGTSRLPGPECATV